MKKLTMMATLLMVVFSLASCKSDSDQYKKFVGSWGVERIEYYNIDYAGDPISNTIEVHEFAIGDPDDGIDLIFNSDKTGEVRRRDIDTFYVKISVNPVVYDTIINPDSTAVTPFLYSYDDEASTVYMTTQDDMHTFMLRISNFRDDSFTYINEYNLNYVEKAWLKRLDNAKQPVKSATKPTYRPRRQGSLLSY